MAFVRRENVACISDEEDAEDAFWSGEDAEPSDFAARFSWDGASSDGDDSEPPLTLRTSVLPANSLQWSLISPCSESESLLASPACVTEPEIEPANESEEDEGDEAQVSTDGNSDGGMLPTSLDTVEAKTLFTTCEPTKDVENEDRAPPIAHTRRLRARTCSGIGSIRTLTLATIKARTQSLSRLRNSNIGPEDDGDFSSDDEGCNRVPRRPSLSFTKQINRAVVANRLKEAKGKLNTRLHLLRSANAVESEELNHAACSVESERRASRLRSSVTSVVGRTLEAARKFQSPDFSAPFVSRPKAPSETEEEEPELTIEGFQ